MPAPEEEQLYYFDSRTEVQLGDLVRYKPICRTSIPGVVTYLPGVSLRHSRFERQGTRQWAIQLENGWILAWVFSPSERQPSRRITFVRRGTEPFRGIEPGDELL